MHSAPSVMTSDVTHAGDPRQLWSTEILGIDIMKTAIEPTNNSFTTAMSKQPTRENSGLLCAQPNTCFVQITVVHHTPPVRASKKRKSKPKGILFLKVYTMKVHLTKKQTGLYCICVLMNVYVSCTHAYTKLSWDERSSQQVLIYIRVSG